MTKFYLNIGHHNSEYYFVYEIPGVEIFNGSYTQCLIFVGAVSTGKSIEDAKVMATGFKLVRGLKSDLWIE